MAEGTLPPDAPALLKLAKSLSASIEQVLMAGLTTAGASTQEQLAVSMKEAARMRLLRLGATIRVIGEELSRFDKVPAKFSPQKLSFFLNRTWILCRGIAQSIEGKDAAALAKLLANPQTVAVKELRAAVIGVGKRVAPGIFSAFEFRMIALGDSECVTRGMQVVWSTVFPAKGGAQIPAEAFLQLPQKQGFKPSILLSKKAIVISDASVSIDSGGVARLALAEGSKITTSDKPIAWDGLVSWNPAKAAVRVAEAKISPIDLDIEMQELVKLDDWSIEIPAEVADDSQPADWPLTCGKLIYSLRTDDSVVRKPIQKAAKSKSDKPSLIGLLHYESCQFVLLPLALLTKESPEYITLSHAQVSAAELVKALQLK